MDTQPVIAGAGQVSNKDDDRIVHPMALVEEATRAALERAAVDPGDVEGIYTTPLSALTQEDPASLLGAALGAGTGPRVVSTYSGAAPQRLLAAACRAVAANELSVAVVAGGIADASVRRARRRGEQPPAPPTSVWSQGSTGPPMDVRRDWGPVYIPEVAAGAGLPSSYFALVQSVIDGGRAAGRRAAELGRLLAPFTEVAARRPELAWFPRARSADEIATVTDDNRMVAEPYTKLMCSFPTVDQAGAMVVTAGPRPGAISVRAISTAREATPPSGRPDMAQSQALRQAVATALEESATAPDDIGLFDLYSCFPAAVLLAAQALGLEPGDRRPLTATGGLPYFGGPGASYSLHGLICLFEDMTALGEPLGLAVGVGGMVTDFSVGIYSLQPAPFRAVELPVPELPPVPADPSVSGRATIEAVTVLHMRDRGPVEAPVIGRTAEGARFGARLRDPDQAAELSGRNLIGTEIEVAGSGDRLVYQPL